MKKIAEAIKKELLNENTSKMLRIFSLFSLLFFAYWGLFILLAPLFRNYQPDLDTLAPWIRMSFTPEKKGSEMHVLFLSSLAYVAASYFLMRNVQRIPWFAKRPAQLVCLGLLLFAVAWVLVTRSSLDPVLMLRNTTMNVLLILFLPVLLVLSYFLYVRLSVLRSSIIVGALLWAVFTAFVVLQLDEASAFDYGFVIGPALKLSFGEKLNSFYMQYGLLMMYFFKWMMSLRLSLAQMQVVSGVLFPVWYVFFWLLARRLIEDKRIFFLCMVALFVVRFLSIRHDPTIIPQTLPFRLDLWAPLVLISSYVGLTSPLSSLAFSLGYLADSSFGFFSLAAYVSVASISLFARKKNGLSLRTCALLILPIACAVALHVYLFRSLFSPAGDLYTRLLIGFMPVSINSFIWIVFAFMPFAFYTFLSDREPKRQKTLLLLFAILLMQLIYFYGRSHDHNLLNLSALLVLIFFFSLDRLSAMRLRYVAVALGGIFIVIMSVLFAGEMNRKLTRAWFRLFTKNVTYTNRADLRVEEFARIRSNYRLEKVYLLSDIDSYIYYRNGIQPPGYFNPFWTNVFLDDTVRFLLGLMDKGYAIVFWKDELFILDFVEKLNQSRVVQERGFEFDYLDKEHFSEVLLIPHATASAKQKGELLVYSDADFLLNFPKDFSVTKTNNGIRLRHNDGVFTVVVEPKRLGEDESVEQYVQEQEIRHGFVEKEGLAQVPNVDYAYVRFWARNPVTPAEKLQFFLFKGKTVLELRVWPITSKLMPKFDQILGFIVIR